MHRLFRFVACFILISIVPAVAAEFLWLSDIHFDPLADHALVDRLAATEPAQWAGILAGGSKKFPVYGRDTNWPLLSSALQASTKIHAKPSFTLVTGDLLVHHFREQFNAIAAVHDDEAFRSFVRKSVEFVGLQLKQRAGGTRVFIALGNNDDECGDYAIEPDGPFLHDTAQLVGDLAGLPNTQSYVHLGSYSAANPAVGHQRIIVLNTIFLSPKYVSRCGGVGTDDPGEQLLTWLGSELESAKSHGEKVWLVYHIPPGVDAYATAHPKTPAAQGAVTMLWKEPYTAKFLSLLTQYKSVVGPNFAGHVHVDDFRLLGGSLKISPFLVIGPAVSPITGQNPTFRTVNFDTRGGLKDEVTYYLSNLTALGQGNETAWRLEYDFGKEWHFRDLNAQSLAKLLTRIEDSSEAAERWALLYSTSRAGSSLAPASWPQYFCAAETLSAQAYRSCMARMETNYAKTTN